MKEILQSLKIGAWYPPHLQFVLDGISAHVASSHDFIEHLLSWTMCFILVSNELQNPFMKAIRNGRFQSITPSRPAYVASFISALPGAPYLVHSWHIGDGRVSIPKVTMVSTPLMEIPPIYLLRWSIEERRVGDVLGCPMSLT
jgi:hypothetical protein